MPTTSRRSFLRSTAALAAASIPAARAQSREARIEVLLSEPIAPIAPEIYGHFVEHLGGVVYDGIWVGENSKIPNSGGLRKQLIDALARTKPAVIRWPGGCFADQYDWRDGIGPRAQRPRRTNFWIDSSSWPSNANRTGPHVYDPNSFGTIEFARLCRLTQSQPYFAANLRSLPAQDFWRWVEYCNSPAGSTTNAGLRARDGESAPLNVRYWGVGNESWGCGGNFNPEEYAVEFRRYTAWVPTYPGAPLSFIGSGPNGGDLNWTRKFFEKAGRSGIGKLWGWGLHHYSWNASAGRTTDWNQGKRDAVTFDNEQYHEILREGQRVENLITSHWDVMGEFDREHRVKIAVDEWGSWYAPGTEPFPEALIGQQNTLRDALLAAQTLDTFHRHADKVAMANIAQLVNCLQSLFLAYEDRFCLTPTYHVFDMYSPHQGAQSIRTLFLSPPVRYERAGQQATLPGLSGSTSRKGNQLTLTVTNPSLTDTREAEVTLHGARIQSVKATLLTAPDVHDHNTFQNPNAVQPKPLAITLQSGGRLIHNFPPASITRFDLVV